MQKSSKHSNRISQHKSLSIQFSLGGFSFCITDFHTKEIITFTKYSFDETVSTPELLLNRVLQVFSEDKNMQQDFESVLVVHQNDLFTIVPNAYFDENTLKTYLNYNIKTLVNDNITFDFVSSINANIVYVPFTYINNYLFQNFGEFQSKHYAAILIDKLIDYSKQTNEKLFFVDVLKNTMNIVVTENSQLILHNTFLYNSKEDFIYYILFVAEQLQMNPNEFRLIFLGDIHQKTDIYDIVCQYVRFVEFIKPTSDFFNNSEEFLNHSNYILIS